MSDSDSVPGEVEYSDDEDYIRNESVMSARHTKIVDGSIVDHHAHHPPQARQNSESIHSQNEANDIEGEQIHAQQVGLPQDNNLSLPNTQVQHQQLPESRQEQPEDVHNQVSGHLLHQQISNQFQAAPVDSHPTRSQDSPENVVQRGEGRRVQAVNSEESNDDEQVYRETYFSEQTTNRQQNKSQLVSEQPKKEQQKASVNITDRPVLAAVDYVQPSKQQPAILVGIREQEQAMVGQKIQEVQVIQQKNQQYKKQPLSDFEKKQKALARQDEPKNEEQPANVSRGMPSEHYTESEQDLLAGMNVVGASSNSELTEKAVQRKLFKTDLQKEEDNVSVPLSSQYEAVQRLSQDNPNNSIQEMMTMTVPQTMPSPKQLGTSRKEETVGHKSEACKCLIM